MSQTGVRTLSSAWTGKQKAIAVAIVLLAVVLRLWGISFQSYWQDEAYSVVLARDPVNAIIRAQIDDSSPPLYYIMLHFWIKVFGDSEVASRLLSALLGVCLVGAVVIVGAALFRPAIGLIAGGMLALSPLAVFYSQEARMYTLAPLLAVISVYYCFLVTEKPSRKAITGLIVFSAAMLYCQNYGVFVLGAECLYILSRRKVRPDPRPMLALMGVVAAYVPWLLVLSRQVSEGKTPWIKEARLDMLFDTILHLSFKSWRLPTTGNLKFLWAVGLLVIFGLSVSAVRFILEARRDEDAGRQRMARSGLLILSYAVVPIVCAFMVSQTKPIYVAGRYDTIVQPGLFIFCAIGLWALPHKSLKIAAASLLTLVLSVSLFAYFTTYEKSNDRTIADFIVKNATDADVVIFTDLTKTPFDCYHPESRLCTLKFPRGEMGWTPQGTFAGDISFFEEEYADTKQRLRALWPEKKELFVVFKRYPAIYEHLLDQLHQEEWLRFDRVVQFKMGHNVENQAEAIIIFEITKRPE
ncbi:glycosyltransferase family 39 protein [bacterium]|nr:glycosyltransferase family 39 protein [bacterium]